MYGGKKNAQVNAKFQNSYDPTIKVCTSTDAQTTKLRCVISGQYHLTFGVSIACQSSYEHQCELTYQFNEYLF